MKSSTFKSWLFALQIHSAFATFFESPRFPLHCLETVKKNLPKSTTVEDSRIATILATSAIARPTLLFSSEAVEPSSGDIEATVTVTGMTETATMNAGVSTSEATAPSESSDNDQDLQSSGQSAVSASTERRGIQLTGEGSPTNAIGHHLEKRFSLFYPISKVILTSLSWLFGKGPGIVRMNRRARWTMQELILHQCDYARRAIKVRKYYDKKAQKKLRRAQDKYNKKPTPRHHKKLYEAQIKAEDTSIELFRYEQILCAYWSRAWFLKVQEEKFPVLSKRCACKFETNECVCPAPDKEAFDGWPDLTEKPKDAPDIVVEFVRKE